MSTLLLTLVLILPGGPPETRPPNPLAPSLPLLSDAEEERLDAIIDRFIAAETGQLSDVEKRRAMEDFRKLGPEATFALIRGLNRAARIETSCPAVVIARKLSALLGASRDKDLLQFARDNLGGGVGRTRHGPLLQNLRVMCGIRQGALNRAGVASAPAVPGVSAGQERTLQARPSVGELARRAGEERGEKLLATLKELGAREGDEALAALGTAAASYEEEARRLARDLLDRQIGRLTAARVRELLHHDRAEVRAAAIRAAAGRKLPWQEEYIGLLLDGEPGVRQAARAALVRLTGKDLGPERDDDARQREEAVRAWRDWWQQRKQP